MSIETIKKLKLYKIIALIFLASTIIISSIFGISISKNKELGKEGFIGLSEHHEILEDLEVANKILSIDQELLAKGNLQQILEKLESLTSNSQNNNLQGIIKNRIDYTKNIIQFEKEINGSNQELQEELLIKSKNIDSLLHVGDSISTSFFAFKRKAERKVDSLILVSKKKENQLVRKETVKVITFKNSSGNLIHYLGETEGDKANGNGVGIWNTGSIYRGEWRHNKRHGVGEFTWSDGQKYSGDFIEDIRTGSGIYYWPSGERYEGQFLNNKRHGDGIFYDPDGNVKFNGEWKNDKFSGT